MRLWVNKIDQIIDRRLDRKGIIHTVSYARVDLIKQWSRHRDIMMTHQTATTRDVVADFKRARAPAVLVSPSMATGWDFPYDECNYQIIGKVPFPDSRDKVLQARTKIDPVYSYYITMQSLVQASGRGMRAEDDICETIVVDDHISWFIGKWGATLAPAWFRQAYKISRTIPEAVKL
jgi:Rad3-related DNA helicase